MGAALIDVIGRAYSRSGTIVPVVLRNNYFHGLCQVKELAWDSIVLKAIFILKFSRYQTKF